VVANVVAVKTIASASSDAIFFIFLFFDVFILIDGVKMRRFLCVQNRHMRELYKTLYEPVIFVTRVFLNARIFLFSVSHLFLLPYQGYHTLLQLAL